MELIINETEKVRMFGAIEIIKLKKEKRLGCQGMCDLMIFATCLKW